MSRSRGGGLASAHTITSWSALATTTRSTGSTSSADLRSTVLRGAILTTLASVPGAPEASPARLTVSPTTMLPRPSSRAFIAVTAPSALTHRYLPRSTAVTNASTASAWAGRRLVRGREPRAALTRTSSSSMPLCLARGTTTEPPASGRREGLRPDLAELRERLADSCRVPHPHAAGYQPEYRSGHDQAVVVVAVERPARMQPGRPDPQPVCRLGDVPAELADFACQRRQPVALVPAQMADSGELRWRARQRRKCGQHRRQLPDLAEIGVDPADLPASGHPQAVRARSHIGSHRREQLDDPRRRLQAVGGPSSDRHLAGGRSR